MVKLLGWDGSVYVVGGSENFSARPNLRRIADRIVECVEHIRSLLDRDDGILFTNTKAGSHAIEARAFFCTGRSSSKIGYASRAIILDPELPRLQPIAFAQFYEPAHQRELVHIEFHDAITPWMFGANLRKRRMGRAFAGFSVDLWPRNHKKGGLANGGDTVVARKNEKPRYGAEFGALLQRYFDSPPYKSPFLGNSSCWTPQRFAHAVGVSDGAVRQWLRGDEFPTKTMELLIGALFGPTPEAFNAEIDALRAVLSRCKLRRAEKHPLPESRSELIAPRIYSDPRSDMIGLNYSDIDALPVEEKWHFDAIRYGEGVQMVEVPGSLLFWLDPKEKMADAHGERRSLTGFFPDSDKILSQLSTKKQLFFPNRIIVTGPKRQNALVRIFACTNIPYENGLDDRSGPYFEADAFLGQGGISAFLNRSGEMRKRSAGEIGNGLGCVVALVAIAYAHRRPVYRSPYCLVIRKGIRYPDDIWISPATNRPVFSSAEPAQGRFLFQSRESKGGSTDMFAAHFNGTFLVNLNVDDETAWDGFVDENGANLVSWKGNRISFGSMVTGKGFIERIEREDTEGREFGNGQD